METTFIESVRTENTGGNVMVDFITLKNGKLIAVSEYGIGLYNNMEHFDSGEEPLNYIEA